MSNIKRYDFDKATVCANKNCVTVYGQNARVINSIIVFTVAMVALSYVAKALK